MQCARNEVVFLINCPNIRRLKENDRWDYVDLDFRCTFRDVMKFSIETPVFDHDAPENQEEEDDYEYETRKESLDFRYGEINGETEALDELLVSTGRRFSSLAIEEGNTGRDLTLIFSNVTVEAIEPGAFDLMLNHPQYVIPLAE